MKKIFPLSHQKHKPERVIEAIKNDIRKYLKRERSKKLPEEADYWDFDCRFGRESDQADTLHSAEIIPAIDKAYEEKWEQCYIEIIAKPAKREVKVEQGDDMEEGGDSTD